MKRTAFVKMLSLVLCLLMLVAVFAACDDKGKTTIAPPAASTTTTTGNGGGDGDGLEIKGPFGIIDTEQVDFGGETYGLLLWTEAKKGIFPEEQVAGTDIRNDLYERNQLLEQELGLKYSVTYKISSSSNQELYNEAQSGKGVYEAICCYSTYPPMLAKEGLLVDMNSLEYPATEMAWYPQQIQNWEISNRLFFVTNNSSIRNIISNWVIFANNVMIEEKGREDIADVVIDGDWTLDVLKSYSRDWASEAEGNGSKAESERVYGLSLIHSTAIEAFYHAAGFQASKRNAAGQPQLVFTTKANIEQVSTFIDTFLEICESPEFGCGDKDDTSSATLASGNWKAPLTNENSVFYAGSLDLYTEIDAESGKFTIIPLPKLNENQDSYYSITNWAFDVWCIPQKASDTEVGAMTIEAMSYDDYTSIAYKFWEKDFKYRYSSDDRGVQIFDIIRNSFYADFVRAWVEVSSPYSTLKECLTSSTKGTNFQNNYATTVGNMTGAAGKSLTQLINQIEAKMQEQENSN